MNLRSCSDCKFAKHLSTNYGTMGTCRNPKCVESLRHLAISTRLARRQDGKCTPSAIHFVPKEELVI